jgi:radical SAM protein with 4Fe4S-binding SPASM domain
MQCPHIPEISYGEYMEKVYQKMLRLHLPMTASLELTERCNLNCAHCYINRPPGDREAQMRELTTSQWQNLLDDMAQAGVLGLVLTGGETLLRDDFRKIYAHAKQRGMIINLFTNGTLIDPGLADFLRDLTPSMMEITVYGRTPQTYEAVTRVAGSYERCLRGIDLLLARGIPLALKTMVMTINAHELWDLKAWAEGLGAKFHYDMMLNARLDGGKQPLPLRLSPEEVVEFDRKDKKRYQEWLEFAEKFVGPHDSEYLYSCGAGLASFSIDSYGKMYPCLISRGASYDVTQGSFTEGWQEFLPKVRLQKPLNEYPCGRCELLSLCEQCPGWSHLEHGEPDRPVNYLCRVAHLRAQLLGLEENNSPGRPDQLVKKKQEKHTGKTCRYQEEDDR